MEDGKSKNPTLYDYLRQFHSVYETGILTDKAVVLYWQMLNMFNTFGWKKWVGVDTAQLMAMLHTTNKTTALRERDVLVKAGMIEYKKGRKGRVSEYALGYSNVTCNVSDNVTHDVTETGFCYSDVTCNVSYDVTCNVSDNVTPHKNEDLRPKIEDISPKQVYLNREVSSPTKSNTTPLYPPTGGACESVPVSDSEKPKKQSKPKKPKEPKVSYAEFVTMTETEHQKLIDKYGEAKTARMIEILNNYKGSTGKTYASDYMTCLNWVAERAEQQLQRNAYQNNAYQGGGYGNRQPPSRHVDENGHFRYNPGDTSRSL